jgi:hypothetical protein
MDTTARDKTMTREDAATDAQYEPTDRRADATPYADQGGDAPVTAEGQATGNVDALEQEVRDATRDIAVDDDKPYKGLRAFMMLLGLAMILGGVALQRKQIIELTAAKEPELPPIVDPEPLAFDPPAREAYPWLLDERGYDPANSIASRIAPPQGYRRVPVPNETFAQWLRHLPIAARTGVLLHTGEEKRNQRAHFAVLDIDIGDGDLLQSADVPIRLRAEYLIGTNQGDRIAFDLASGEPAAWTKWAKGYRPTFEADGVAWSRRAEPDDSYASFRAYLAEIFQRTDTGLLASQLQPIRNPANMNIGDMFLHPGKPGHCVIVLDMAEDIRTGARLFLLAQGFMPAQDVHLLINPTDADISPWHSLDFGKALVTPEYRFGEDELMRFAE